MMFPFNTLFRGSILGIIFPSNTSRSVWSWGSSSLSDGLGLGLRHLCLLHVAADLFSRWFCPFFFGCAVLCSCSIFSCLEMLGECSEHWMPKKYGCYKPSPNFTINIKVRYIYIYTIIYIIYIYDYICTYVYFYIVGL